MGRQAQDLNQPPELATMMTGKKRPRDQYTNSTEGQVCGCPLANACTIPHSLCLCCPGMLHSYNPESNWAIELFSSKTGTGAKSKVCIPSYPELIGCYHTTSQPPSDPKLREQLKPYRVQLQGQTCWPVLKHGKLPLVCMLNHKCVRSRNIRVQRSNAHGWKLLETANANGYLLPESLALLKKEEAEKGEVLEVNYYNDTQLTRADAIENFGTPCCCTLCELDDRKSRFYQNANDIAVQQRTLAQVLALKPVEAAAPAEEAAAPAAPAAPKEIIDLTNDEVQPPHPMVSCGGEPWCKTQAIHFLFPTGENYLPIGIFLGVRRAPHLGPGQWELFALQDVKAGKWTAFDGSLVPPGQPGQHYAENHNTHFCTLLHGTSALCGPQAGPDVSDTDLNKALEGTGGASWANSSEGSKEPPNSMLACCRDLGSQLSEKGARAKILGQDVWVNGLPVKALKFTRDIDEGTAITWNYNYFVSDESDVDVSDVDESDVDESDVDESDVDESDVDEYDADESD